MTILLTFDTDYMLEDDLYRFCEQFRLPPSTFYLWKPFRDLDLATHELAPHPFFTETRPWTDTLKEFEDAWGRTAITIRPHSCAYSHKLGVALAARGYRAISQAWFPLNIHLRPVRHPWGLWELPIYYMDSMDFTFSRNWPGVEHRIFDKKVVDSAISSKALFVFDFHPLHVIMNTNNYDQYAEIKNEIVCRKLDPFKTVFSGNGTRSFFEYLLAAIGGRSELTARCDQFVQLLDHTVTGHDVTSGPMTIHG